MVTDRQAREYAETAGIHIMDARYELLLEEIKVADEARDYKRVLYAIGKLKAVCEWFIKYRISDE